MPLWAGITLIAACFQVARTGLQKSLAADIGNLSGTWVRFGCALPFVPLLLAALPPDSWRGISLASLPLFFAYCLFAALAQIIATFFLLVLFGKHTFVAGNAFAKTEGIQIALLGALVFSEPPSALGWLGIALGSGGVLLLSCKKGLVFNRQAVAYGLGAGFFFALTAWFIRASYGALALPPFTAAALTLSVMLVLQTLLLGGYMCMRQTAWNKIWQVRWRAAGAGALSFAGSLGWLWAFALANPAYVKILAQIELPLAYLLGKAAFSEHSSRAEIAGLFCAAAGAILVIFT